MKKILCKDWGIKPWEFDKLTARDIQDVFLAEHAETYIEQSQRERAENRNSISHSEYDVKDSRAKAFQ